MTENEFQDCCEKLVHRNILANVTEMADYIIRKSCEDEDAPFSFNDLECLDNEDEDEDPYDYEWFEVFIVSDWLADRLYEHGSLVYRSEYAPCLWFRGTFGQMTHIDTVIRKIERDRQIAIGTDPKEFDGLYM